MKVAQPIEWTDKGVEMLDQRRLPGEVIRHTYTDYRDVAAAITDMVIRGAPAIGVAAAMGVALGVQRSNARSMEDLRAEFPAICQTLSRTRPTAVDLFWAIERMNRRFEQLAAANTPPEALRRAMVEEARAIHAEKRATDEAMGRFGADLMPAAGQVMTQCNAGALATAGIGSALGVIRVAVEQGRKLHVLVPETRPYLQGARLTAWELHEGGVPLTLITDNMVGHFMKSGGVGAVVVGADRIGQRRYGEQDRNVPNRRAREGTWRAVLRGRACFHLRSHSFLGRTNSDRRALGRGSDASSRRAHRSGRARCESCVRCHSSAPHFRNHLRTRRGPRAVRGVAPPSGGFGCSGNAGIIPITPVWICYWFCLGSSSACSQM